MNTHDRHRLERHTRRLEELRLWRNAYEVSVEGWRFVAGGGEEHYISPGDFWPEAGIPARFSATTNIPEDWTGLPVELELWLGGEGFVKISTEDHQVSGGLNPFHRSFAVATEARGGDTIRIEAEVVSKGIFGSNVAEPRLVRARLVVPQTEVRVLERDLSAVFEACAILDDHEAVPLLLDVLDTATAILSAGCGREDSGEPGSRDDPAATKRAAGPTRHNRYDNASRAACRLHVRRCTGGAVRTTRGHRA